MAVLIRVLELVGPTMSQNTVDGLWLASFDVEAFDGGGDAVFTIDPDEAMRFPDVGAAFEAWRTQSKTHPLRPDGKPNRPLTAFSITFDEVNDAEDHPQP